VQYQKFSNSHFKKKKKALNRKVKMKILILMEAAEEKYELKSSLQKNCDVKD